MKIGNEAPVYRNGKQEKSCLKQIPMKERVISLVHSLVFTLPHSTGWNLFIYLFWHCMNKVAFYLLCFNERKAGGSPWVSLDRLIILEAVENLPIFPR